MSISNCRAGESSLSSKFTEFTKESSLDLEKKKIDLEVSLQKDIETTMKDFLSKIESTKSEIYNIKIDFVMQKANLSYDNQHFSNAIVEYTEVLERAKQGKFTSHHVGFALDNLLNSIKKLKSKELLSGFRVRDIRSVLDELPPEYSNYRTSISKAIDELLES